MAPIYSNTNRECAVELVKAALSGGVLSQISTDKLTDTERVKAHSLYIMRMIGSLEMRLDEQEAQPKKIAK